MVKDTRTIPIHQIRKGEPAWVKALLITGAIGILVILIGIPVLHVFYRAFENGLKAYWTSLTGNRDTLHSIWLTLSIAPRAVLLNLIFGVAAAWAVARFRFPGRTFFLALIDLPLAISPVVAGLFFVLLFGMNGWFGEWLDAHGLQVLFGTPALVLATSFVTLPFIVRELIPVMEAYGDEEELAGISLGASGWQMFWRITLPNIRWGLLYGMILCNARAMGEYGAVYMISGRISGLNDTMPLRVEKLFQEYDMAGAFALASLLTLLSLVTLGLKTFLDKKYPVHEKSKEGQE